jgi:hypothetical protein
MFAHCCSHATFVALRQPLTGAIGATRRQLRSNLAFEMARRLALGTQLRGQSGRRNRFEREASCPPSRDHGDDGHDNRHGESQRSCIVRSFNRHDAIERVRHYVVRHPQCAKRIASFLCGQHFFAPVLSRDDTATHSHRLRIRLSYKGEMTFRMVCSRCFRSPPEMRHAPGDRPHDRLSCHRIAPASRKSAVYTSSHRPV